MLKKVFSKALLSVVMDKKARATLEAAQARADAPTPPAAPASPEELRAAARQALEAAQKELAGKPKLTVDRKALILEALAVQKRQTRLLDELPKAQKQKLQAMAQEAFGITPDKGAKPGRGKR